MNKLSELTDQILSDLISHYYSHTPYYMKDKFNYVMNDDDDIFITDEEIVEHVKKKLSDEYTLTLIPTKRKYKSIYEDGDFEYWDTELKITKNNG